MKKVCFICLVGFVSLISINGLLAAGEWKETEISKNIRMHYKPNIIPPGPDVPTEIAAFSGRWEGKAEYPQSEWILVVEEVNPKKAKVIYGWRVFSSARGRGSSYYSSNDSSRFQAEIIPGLKPLLKFNIGNTTFKFESGDSPETLKGTREIRGQTITTEMMLHKIE